MGQFLRLSGVGLKQVGHFKDQVQCAAVADPHLLVGSQAVKHRQTGSKVGADPESGRCLSAVTVGHQQICPNGSCFQIFQIPHKDFGTGQTVQTTGAGGGYGCLIWQPMLARKRVIPFRWSASNARATFFVPNW